MSSFSWNKVGVLKSGHTVFYVRYACPQHGSPESGDCMRITKVEDGLDDQLEPVIEANEVMPLARAMLKLARDNGWPEGESDG